MRPRCMLYALWGELERPCEHQGDREAEDRRQDDSAVDPVRKQKAGTNRRAAWTTTKTAAAYATATL